MVLVTEVQGAAGEDDEGRKSTHRGGATSKHTSRQPSCRY